MRLETDNNQVSYLVDDAMLDIDAFRRTKQLERLSAAATKLDRARTEDPDYLPALYGRAIVDQLGGRAADAVMNLERVIAENPPFADEAEYHLGVAFYQRYNWPSLEQAITHLSSVAARTSDPLLKCRARVVLMRAYGMRMIPQDPRDADLDQIRHYFDLLQEEAGKVEPMFDHLPPTELFTRDELKSELHNAKGLAWMYWSDFFGSTDEKCAALERALSELQIADTHDPDDWAIQCDLGSTWMRLGHWRNSEAGFTHALAHLARVVDTLRPKYGFALYEIGRACRLMGRFGDAIRHFDSALAIPYEYRDVSDRRLLLEKARAEAYSKEYP